MTNLKYTNLKYLLTIVLLTLSACMPASKAQSDEATVAPTVVATAIPSPTPLPREGLAARWLDMSIGPGLIEWFNTHAYPDDVARVDHFSRIDMLDKVTVGRKLVVFKSAHDAEQLMPHLGDKMDIIGYNLEHGPGNRPDEQADPIGSIQRMRALADEYDKLLAYGPDRRFALSDGAAMAPYTDIFVLQVQRVQEDHATVREFVLPMVQELRAANPNIEISIQVRTEGDMKNVVRLLNSLLEELTGISILTSQETVETAKELVTEIRPQTAQGPTSTEVPNPQAAQQLPPAVLEKTRAAAKAAAVQVAEERAAGSISKQPDWPLFTALMTTSVVLFGFLVTTVLYALRTVRPK